MPERFFGRYCELQLGIPGAEARSWTDLRVSFSVKHTSRSRPSAAKVKVYNLAPGSREFAGRDGLFCWVRAGYDADRQAGVLPVVVQGDVTLVDHARMGPDWVTTIYVGDGAALYRGARISRSVAGLTRRDALRQLVEPLDVAVDATGLVGRLTDPEWNEPIDAVIEGSIEHAMREVLLPGWTWTIIDGELKLVPPTDVLEERAYVLSSDSGLVGSPKRKIRTTNRRPRVDGVEATSLLIPELRAGRAVQVQSSELAGNYVIREVTHAGDTHDDQWFSTLQLRERGA